MQIHNVVRQHKNKKKTLVGRGGTRGKTSGRGGKGQTARAGNKRRPEIRDIIKKLPKQRGYRFNSIQNKSIPVNLSLIEKNFESKELVSPVTLLEKKVISKSLGKTPVVKILATGTLTKALKFEGCKISKTAKDIIEKAGGSVA